MKGLSCFFLIQSQLWGTDGHLHAPRFFGTGKKSRSHRGQANLNFHDFFDQKPIMGNRWAPARASIFWDWKRNPDRTGDRPILTFMMLFNQRPIMGSRWAPARATIFLGLDKNHDTYRDRPIWNWFFCFANNALWGPDEHLHHSLVFCRLATKSRNPTSKKPDSPRNRPISEHTLVQPRTSSSDIEWGTPFPPTPSLKYLRQYYFY